MGAGGKSEVGAVMRLRFFPPALVAVTEAMPDGVAGDARGPVIRVRANHWARGDEGLLQHEIEHVRQFYRMWIIGAIINAPFAA